MCVTEGLPVRHYFVDEAGDTVLFGKRGGELVGTDKCSKYFLVGVAHLPDPLAADAALRQLRSDLLADPYFSGVPSMQLAEKKTAICFHAKDDLPEVRREVFRLLRTFDPTVQVAVRSKRDLLTRAWEQYSNWATKRRGDADLYDELVERSFADLLHHPSNIIFARRGKRERQQALRQALINAQKRGRESRPQSDHPLVVRTARPSQSAGLQVIDYYLWALQRLLERGEDRFFRMMEAHYQVVVVLDDHRNNPDGERYGCSNPLTLEKIKALT